MAPAVALCFLGAEFWFNFCAWYILGALMAKQACSILCYTFCYHKDTQG